MKTICVKIPLRHYQELEAKAREHEVTLSDIFRECLQTGLQCFRQPIPTTFDNQKPEVRLQKRIATNTLVIYCLLEAFVKNKVENGEQLCDDALRKGERMTMEMLSKVLQLES